MIVIISMITTVLYFAGNLIVTQLISLVDDLPELGQSIFQSIASAMDQIEGFIMFSPGIFEDLFQNAVDYTISGLGTLSTNLGKSILSAITILPGLLFSMLIALIATYYISNDLHAFSAWWKKFSRRSEFVNNIRSSFQNDITFALVAYLKAQGILMIITFIIILIGLLLMGYSYAVVIALGVAILDALPIFGTGTIFGPWIIIELLNGDYRTAIFLAIIYIIAAVVRQLLQPKILSSQIGLNPFLTLASIYIGIRLLGVFGIILGPMLLILIISITKSIKKTNVKFNNQ
jgi:sporulation integral membrane protein YtvI